MQSIISMITILYSDVTGLWFRLSRLRISVFFVSYVRIRVTSAMIVMHRSYSDLFAYDAVYCLKVMQSSYLSSVAYNHVFQSLAYDSVLVTHSSQSF